MPVLEESELDKTVLLNALIAVKRGEFETRLPNNWTGLDGKIADAFNAMVELNAGLKTQLETVSRAVGGEGKTGHRIPLAGADGGWASCVSCVNDLVDDLVWPTSEIARVIGGVARGDLTQTMELEVQGRVLKGEFLRTARTVNIMVEQLNGFASGRQVGRSGARQRSVGNLERSVGQRQLDGRQPDRPGAQHRGRDHRRGARRSFQENHRGRAW